MVEPRHVHLIATKHVLRYLKGTFDYGLQYVVDCKFIMVGYTDSDWSSSVTDWKSTSGCCFSLGSMMISWRSRKQTSEALSTDEAEYISTCSTCNEVVWLQKFLSRLFDLELDVTCIFCDNQSCIKFSENPVFHDKSKNVDIKYYIHDMVEKGVVKLQCVAIDYEVVDVLTKPLSKVKFEYFRDNLGVVQKDVPCKRE